MSDESAERFVAHVDTATGSASRTVDVVVGRLGRPHGVRGDVLVDVRTDEPERRFAPGTTFATAAGTLTVASARWHSSRLIVSFDEVHDRPAAERLRGIELGIEVSVDDAPDDPDEFYDHQLLGLRVEDAAGTAVGSVAEVLHLPGQDLLVVRRNSGAESLVPFVTELVPTVDLPHRRLVLADVPGLLDDASDEGGTPALPRPPGTDEP